MGVATASDADRLNDQVLRQLLTGSSAPTLTDGADRRRPGGDTKFPEKPQPRGLTPGSGDRGLLPPRPFERCATPPCARF